MGKRRVGLVFGVWTFLLLVAVFGAVLNVPLVRGSGTIYIRRDGSVDPPTTPVQRDGDLYTFTDNIYDEIVVQRGYITIDGDGYTLQGSGSGNGFYLTGLDNVTIKNVNIRDFQNGVMLKMTGNNTISGNTITNGEYGIFFDRSEYNNVSGNTITNSSSDGVYLEGYSDDNTVSGNTITDTDNGVHLEGANNNTVSGNTIKNSNNGILLYSSDYSNVSGNTITNSSSDGVHIEYFSDDNTVSGNMITDTDNGVHLNWVPRHNNVSGNMITNSSRGVYIETNSDYNSVSGNTIKNSNSGVYIEGGSDDNTVSGNTIKNSTYFGVYLNNSDRNTVSGNTIKNTTYHGVSLYNSHYNNVSGNTIKNGDYAVYLNQSFSNTVSGNTIKNSTSYGVYLNRSSNNRFYHNNFINNTVHVYVYLPHLYSNDWNYSYPSGGNYWSDYTGDDHFSGPDQNMIRSDGIGDTPYEIDWIHQDNYPLMYPYGSIRNLNTSRVHFTIRSAIDDAETLNGHVIFVKSWTYYESVFVWKTLSLVGENKQDTIIDGNGFRNVIEVTADNVTITGFTIQNSESLYSGIYVDNSSGNNIRDNIIKNNYRGIRLYESNYTNVSENIITQSGYYGVVLERSSHNNTVTGNAISYSSRNVVLEGSHNNTVSGNTLSYSSRNIDLYLSSNNTVSGNTITNSVFGVHLDFSPFNNVSGNTITTTDNGVALYLSSNNTVSGNTITNSKNIDIFLEMSHNNTVSGNTIKESGTYGVYLKRSGRNTVSGNTIANSTSHGVVLHESGLNTVSGNTITNSTLYGLRVYQASGNRIYHNNFINNTNQVYIYEPIWYPHTNVWDDGYPSGGNYWSDYEDRYPDAEELDNSGIWNTAYVIDANYQDNYPLMNPLSVIINEVVVSNNRTDVGSEQTVAFHAKWSAGASNVTEGTIYVNEKGYPLNATGWISFNPVYDTVGKRVWTVTGVLSDYITAYQQTVEDPHIIWDRVNITVSVSDDRINVGSTASITATGTYEYDDFQFTGTITSFNDTLTKNVVGKYGYKVASISDPTYELTSFTTNEVSVIFDKVKVTLSAEDDTAEAGSAASITKSGVYLYDGEVFDGTITLNDTETKSIVGTFYYTTQSISGDTYGITAFESNAISVTFVDTTLPNAKAGSDQTVVEDTTVTFDGSGSTDIVGVTSWKWTFTDVTPQTLTGEKPTYPFATPGAYVVTLTVKDAAGNPATDRVTITVLVDTDGDRMPDVTDLDDDNDGVNDDEDAFPLDPTEWVDTDGDRIGNNADTDDDNDGMPDTWEIENELNPLDAADASLDPDGDGLTNLEEYQQGTDPNVSDAEAFPLWIIGVAAALIGIAVAATFLWRRRK